MGSDIGSKWISTTAIAAAAAAAVTASSCIYQLKRAQLLRKWRHLNAISMMTSITWEGFNSITTAIYAVGSTQGGDLGGIFEAYSCLSSGAENEDWLLCCLSFFSYHMLNCVELVSSGVYCGDWELLVVALSGRSFSGECGWGERERRGGGRG
jgi:hypothetical protein